MDDSEWKKYLAYLKSIPMAERLRVQNENKQEAERLHQEFTEAFSKGICDSCGKAVNTFAKTTPCFHWLLRPGKSKKNNIEQVLVENGYFRCSAYIRWVANYEDHFRNINNLADEGNRNALFHWSAKYKDRKWTFWCTRNDYEGHGNQPPHFHVAMQIADRPFVKFNDFHIPFTDEDLFNLRSHEDPESPIKQSFGFHGAGLEEAFTGEPDKIFEQLTTTEDEEKAVYHIQTILHSEDGIPGEVISEAMEKAKRAKVPVAKILRELGYEASVAIEPAESLIEKENRNNPRKRRGLTS